MAKRTAVIDIGSNSARLAIYEKTSRFGFHLLNETKSTVRISEGCYENGGFLQKIPMQRALNAIEEFKNIATSLKCNKILCVATSAIREAKNQKEFLAKVKKESKINIKVINGDREAFFGAVSALNLLPKKDSFVTIDIGGGSTELALIKNSKIIKTKSLKLGTIRVKELFFDKSLQNNIDKFFNDLFQELNEEFDCDCVVGIGGTLRAISKLIMKKSLYPLNTLHAFEYDFLEYENFISNIQLMNQKELKNIGVKSDRLDTIREGSAIFYALSKKLKAKKVITSGAGVREGVFLSDMLRNSNLKFPVNFNPSVRNLLDKFIIDRKNPAYVSNISNKLFELLSKKYDIDTKLKETLLIASKLTTIGVNVNFYSTKEHSFYFILNALNYKFTHTQKLLIAILTKYQKRKLPDEKFLNEYKDILPPYIQIKKINFILTLALMLNKNLIRERCEFELIDKKLIIKHNKSLYLAKESIKNIEIPIDIKIDFQQI